MDDRRSIARACACVIVHRPSSVLATAVGRRTTKSQPEDLGYLPANSGVGRAEVGTLLRVALLARAAARVARYDIVVVSRFDEVVEGRTHAHIGEVRTIRGVYCPASRQHDKLAELPACDR